MSDFEADMACYEKLRDDCLAEGLGGLLPADFDKEKLGIAEGTPITAFYIPTMSTYERRDDGTWFVPPLEPPFEEVA